MDEEKLALSRLEQLLEENLEISEENNKILRDMRRTARVGFFFKIIIWAIVIILPIIFIGPVLNMLFPAASGGDAAPGLNVPGFPSRTEVERMLRAYESGELSE